MNLDNVLGPSTPITLSPSQLTTSEVQGVVVEHIVWSNELASQSHAPLKLKTFSGKMPIPNFEVDFDTWRANLYRNDPTISDALMVRRILGSLASTASNIVKPLGPLASSKAYLDLILLLLLLQMAISSLLNS